jgi:hypothetical protein
MVADGSGWTIGLGSTANDEAKAVATDPAGNVYVAGRFSGSVDFDPGDAEVTLTSAGGTDAYVAKYTPAGSLAWVRQVGVATNVRGYGVAVDPAGYVVTTGWFTGTGQFGAVVAGNPVGLTSAGGADAVVLKLNASGGYAWAARLGGAGTEEGYGVAVGAAGNIYATGFFQGTADFNPGSGTAPLTSAGANDNDVYVSKLDASGGYVWARKFGGAALGTDQGNAVAVDAAGNIYATGFFHGTVDFDPGTGTAPLTSAGAQGVFVAKLTPAGGHVWVRQFGGPGDDLATAVAVDASGNVVVAGLFGGTADFAPGAGTATLTAVAGDDAFGARLSNAVPVMTSYGGATAFRAGGRGAEPTAGVHHDRGRRPGRRRRRVHVRRELGRRVVDRDGRRDHRERYRRAVRPRLPRGRHLHHDRHRDRRRRHDQRRRLAGNRRRRGRRRRRPGRPNPPRARRRRDGRGGHDPRRR